MPGWRNPQAMEVDAVKGSKWGKDGKGKDYKGKSKGKWGKDDKGGKGKTKTKDKFGKEYEAKLCIHCGKKGHLVEQCWAKAKGAPKGGKVNVVDTSNAEAAATAAAAPTTMPAVMQVQDEWVFAVVLATIRVPSTVTCNLIDDGTWSYGILDSRACTNIAGKDTFKDIKNKLREPDGSIRLVTAQGTPLKQYGRVEMQLQLGNVNNRARV